MGKLDQYMPRRTDDMKINRYDSCARIGNGDCFGTIYGGMCESKAYQALSIGAKQFYTYCRVQAQSNQAKRYLDEHSERSGNTYTEHDFVFPTSHLAKYGMESSNASRYFKELENAGFIVRKEKNKQTGNVNVYAFSDRWKTCPNSESKKEGQRNE